MVGALYLVLGLPSDPLAEICKPHEHFKNIYDLNERDFKIVSIGHSVSEAIQFEIDGGHYATYDLYLERTLREGKAQCDGNALVVSKCLNREGIPNEIFTINIESDGSHHTYNSIDGRILDTTLRDIDMVYFYKDGKISINHWAKEFLGMVNFTEPKQLNLNI